MVPALIGRRTDRSLHFPKARCLKSSVSCPLRSHLQQLQPPVVQTHSGALQSISYAGENYDGRYGEWVLMPDGGRVFIH